MLAIIGELEPRDVELVENTNMDKVDCEARLLYICKRSEPPHYVQVSFFLLLNFI